MMSNLILPRIAIAPVWIYQGLWCKLLGHAPHHQKIVETTPFLNSSWARKFLVVLGVFECVLAAWAFSGIRASEGAVVQTVLLISMNTTALLRARNLISDPVGMLLQNCVFLILAWIAAGQLGCYAAAA
jgi:DoxX-like family